MSQQLPCNLLLGIQTVSLRVNKEEEFCVRNAALLVNRLFKFYEKKANSSDPNAVLTIGGDVFKIISSKKKKILRDNLEETIRANTSKESSEKILSQVIEESVESYLKRTVKK
jgi:hypothetical protein